MQENKNVGKVKHKAETARHFPRYKIPAYLQIEGKRYKLKDWSLGGCAIEGLEDEILNKGWTVADFIVPFDTFDAVVKNIKLEFIRRSEDGTVGCRFTELDPYQASLLQDVIEAYLEGSIITLDEFINVIKREDLREALEKRRPKAPKSTGIEEKLRKLFILGMFLFVVLFLVLFLLTALHARVYTITPLSAFYDADIVVAKTPERGFFKLAKGLSVGQKVKKGQILGYVDTPFLGSFIVVSPTDGKIIKLHVLDGQGVSIGEPLISIIPEGKTVYIRANIIHKDSHLVREGMEVSITDPSGQEFRGIIRKITSAPQIQMIHGSYQSYANTWNYDVVRIEIKDKKIPYQKLGSSVFVEIDTSPDFLKPVFRLLW